MAGEITVRCGLQIIKNNVKHRPPVHSFKADINTDTPFGPAPGSVPVTTEGTDIDFSMFIDPGWHEIVNQENTGGTEIQIGPYDPETDRYYPMWKLAPGEAMVGQFDELFGWEVYPASGVGTGTGTSGETTRLRLRAKSHDCYVYIGAFER